MPKIIIANWKMKLSVEASLKLAAELSLKLKKTTKKIVICPDFLSLPLIASLVKTPIFSLGAQNSAICEFGALTGEISPASLKELGVAYVILGHSERRGYQSEDSQMINLKIKAALAAGSKVALCIGENLVQKKSGQAKKIIVAQIREALRGIKIKNSSDLMIAYEPLWAIGSGQPIEPEEANKLAGFIGITAKSILKKAVIILYGGSVDSINAAEFLRQKNISGLLVGGASLKAAEFIKICA
jgi:triosephosphate isomerase